MQKTYRIVLQKEEDGRYTASVPSLPGCITFGDNVDHAIEMIKEAVELYIEELRERGEHIPDDSDTFEYSLSIAV